MRAVTFQAPGEVRVDEVPDPDLVEPDDAIVRVAASGICGSDLHIYHGRVQIEPGFVIGHEFVETASASIAEIDHGPYAKFNADVARVPSAAYTGPMARFGAGPEAVAAKISRALTSRRPGTRYKVTPSASLVIGMRRVMSDRMWDRFVRSQYPRPKPEA